jgi:tetratricopeptide (TPR) repeat protein
MSPKENKEQENEAAEAAPSLAEGAEEKLPQDHPMHHHAQLVSQFRESVEREGEEAYKRWGLPLYHSLPDEEVEAQRRALGVKPVDALDHYNRGCLLAAQEDFAAAAQQFAQAVKLDPEMSEALFNLALAQEKAGRLAEARKSWNQFVERFGDQEEAAQVRDHLAQLAG